jgi:beta-glucosidase
MKLGVAALQSGRIPGIDPAEFVFTDIFQARMPGIEPLFEKAAVDLHPDATTILDALRRHDVDVRHAPVCTFESATEPTAEAVSAAVGDADIVVVAVGERTGWVGNNTAGEGQSTAEPRLPGDQDRLVALAAATGRPVVTVVVSGRPLLIAEVVGNSNAVLLAPLLGEEAGRVVAEHLVGALNPSGKLPTTFPRSLGQIPMYHGHTYGSGYDHPTGTRHGYGDLDDQRPLFAFGHGLSYTSFEVSLDAPVEVVGGELIVRAEVRNTGTAAGETVVQVYARDEAASVVRPVRQLIGFQRVALDPGGTRVAEIRAPLARLAYSAADGSRVLEAGEVTVMVGTASDDLPVSCGVTAPETRVPSAAGGRGDDADGGTHHRPEDLRLGRSSTPRPR